MIPPFNPSGVLPPYVGASPADPAGLSPFDATIREVAEALATTADRAELLRGLIALRQQLVGLGITDGYQWYAGSFCEDIETTQGRSPKDIDVVTFFVRPSVHSGDTAWNSFVAANRSVFSPPDAKAAYKCDAYFVDANTPLPNMISQVTYWHGLFGHQRVSHLWKGILRVPLVSDDIAALAHLARVCP